MGGPCLPCAAPGVVLTETLPYRARTSPPELEQGPRLRKPVEEEMQWEAVPLPPPGPLEAHLAPTRPHCKSHRLTS